jgi:hypothetical protein
MWRWTVLAVVSAVLLGVGSAASSPVKGPRRQPLDDSKRRGRLETGSKYVWREAFRGNERACVLVEGDHKPSENLKIVVTDARGNIVARDDGPGDFVCAIWYPPRTGDYVITITGDAKVRGDGKDYDDLDIVVK